MSLVSFTAFDRCDGCGAQALAQAEKPGTEKLMFCFHHLKKCYDALLEGGWTITEEYEAIQNLGQTPIGAY